MPKRIPITAASGIAKAHNCRQVIVVAWDGKKTHVVTYGVNLEECDQAAEGGNRVKAALGWPESLCGTETARVMGLKSRVEALKVRIADLEARLKNGDGVARMVNKHLAARITKLEAELASAKGSLNMLRLGIDEFCRTSTEKAASEADVSTGSDPGDDPDYAGY